MQERGSSPAFPGIARKPLNEAVGQPWGVRESPAGRGAFPQARQVPACRASSAEHAAPRSDCTVPEVANGVGHFSRAYVCAALPTS
jgi:hypothetical protein